MSPDPPRLTDVVRLAARWVEVLAPVAGPSAVGEELTELAGRLALAAGSALHDRDQAARTGEQLGRQLAEANLTGPQAVHRAVSALGDHWLADPRGVDPACVTAMQGGLAAGHAAAVQQLLLAQQESIHRATVAARDLAQDRLRHEATHDRLTGLANRASFLQQLRATLAGAPGRIALGLLRLDDFAAVNLAHGHGNGDLVLRQLAGRLAETVDGVPCLLARFDGTVFAALLPYARPGDGHDLATRLLTALDLPFPMDDTRSERVTAHAAGVELVTSQTHPDAALRAAHLALRAARATDRAATPGG